MGPSCLSAAAADVPPANAAEAAVHRVPHAIVVAGPAGAGSLAQALASWDWIVAHGGMPADAPAAAGEEMQADAVFLDAAVVQTRGPACCRQARQRWLRRGGPLFVFGEPPDAALAEAVLREGASDWLRQPLTEAELAARLRPHLDLGGLHRQVDRQRHRVQALQRSLEEQARLAAIGMVAAGMAHEVNNPNNFVKLSAENLRHELGLFRAYLEGMLDDDADPDIRADLARRFDRLGQHLDLVRDGCRLIGDVVQAVRPHARVDSGPEVVDLAALLARTVRLVGVAFGRTVRFELELADSAPVRCQPGPMQQVFVNLLVNACQAIEARATDRGDCGPGRVRAVSRLQDGQLRLGVLDDGCGMSDEVQKRLFEPFFTTKDATRGTGLGLGICRDIVQGLGGDIEVRSQPGQGTEMWLRLPVATEAAP